MKSEDNYLSYGTAAANAPAPVPVSGGRSRRFNVFGVWSTALAVLACLIEIFGLAVFSIAALLGSSSVTAWFSLIFFALGETCVRSNVFFIPVLAAVSAVLAAIGAIRRKRYRANSLLAAALVFDAAAVAAAFASYFLFL